jgi:integrase
MLYVKPKTIDDITSYKNVEQFLNSKARNSENTSEIYGIAIGYLETFLKEYNSGKYNVETIISPLIDKKLDVYKLLDNFVGFLQNRENKLSAKSISLYVAGIRSYFEFFDLEISPRKFKARVVLPKTFKIKKKALDSSDIRTLLLACSDQRLKAVITILASSGARIMEVLTLTNREIDFRESPTKITISAENSKTKQERNILISQEATEELKMFLKKKYGIESDFKKYPNHLLFAKFKTNSETINPRKIYLVLHRNFKQLLKKVNMDTFRTSNRYEINFHLFRTYFKSVVATQTNSDFSEFMLGHEHSTYWSIPDKEIKRLYLNCEKYLSFLDYAGLEATGRSIEKKLEEKDREIEKIKSEYSKYSKEIEKIREKQEKLDRLYEEAEKNPTHLNKLLARIARPSKDKDSS